MACLVESILYPVDDLVSYFQILLRYLLVFVHLFNQLLDVSELLLSFRLAEVYHRLLVSLHHTDVLPLLLSLHLIAVVIKPLPFVRYIILIFLNSF